MQGGVEGGNFHVRQQGGVLFGSQQLIQALCSLAGRSLSAGDWRMQHTETIA